MKRERERGREGEIEGEREQESKCERVRGCCIYVWCRTKLYNCTSLYNNTVQMRPQLQVHKAHLNIHPDNNL